MDFNFYFTNLCQFFLSFYVCFYISVSGWLKLEILNFVVSLTIIVFARLFIIYLYVTNVNIKKIRNKEMNKYTETYACLVFYLSCLALISLLILSSWCAGSLLFKYDGCIG